MTAMAGCSTPDPPIDGLPAKTSYIQLAETGFSDTVLKALDRLREKSVLTDAIICVEDQELHCHKVVLSSCSDVFCQMFSTSTNDTTQRIRTSIVSADTMRQLVDFVYKGKVEVQRSDVKKLEVASKLYGVCSLSQQCERSLETVKREPVLDCVGSDDVELEAGRQQNAEMSVLDSGTPADIVERVRVKEEDNSREIGEKIYTNDGNGYEAMDWNVTSRACLTDAEPARGRDTDKSTEAMPEPVHEIDAESQFSREGDKDAMDHAESDMQCKCVQCMGSVQSMELIQCRAMLKLPMGKDCGEFFRSLALFRLHERQHDMGVSRVTCPSCLQTFPLFGNCGQHFWNAHNDGTTWQDDDPHLPAAESENYIQEYSEQQSENDMGHNMEPQPQFEILASENQSDSVVVNTCSESLSSGNYHSEVSRSKHYTCKLCGELFNPFSLFCLHIKQRAQDVSTNTCPMCGQTFSSYCSLGRHFKNVHKNKITSVNMISIGNTSENKPGDYSKQGPLSGSLSSQSIDGSVNGASTDDEYAAIDDEGNGTIKRSKYWCQKCGKKFFKVLSFKIHESQHEKGLSELQCPLCGWDYAHFKGLLKHFKKQHKSKLEEWGGGK